LQFLISITVFVDVRQHNHAAAIGRPIITTHAIGCKEAVDDGVNGFLCQTRDAVDLANKIEKMLLLSHAQRVEMGLKGREKVEREFDEKWVIEKYLEKLVLIKKAIIFV
jgi:glycosyltransferase involved in cell wall biosynthesis